MHVEIDVRRFIFLFALGALIAAAAQTALCLGIHPEHLAPFTWVGPGSAAFILGTAMAVTGLLALGERYQRIARLLPALVDGKQMDDALDIPLRDAEAIHYNQHRFWRGYRHAAFALCLFFCTLLAMSLYLIENDASFITYMTGLSADIAIFGVLGLLWTAHALRLARQGHISAQATRHILEQQPDRLVEVAVPISEDRTRVRWGNRPSRKKLYSGHLERKVRPLAKR